MSAFWAWLDIYGPTLLWWAWVAAVIYYVALRAGLTRRSNAYDRSHP